MNRILLSLTLGLALTTGATMAHASNSELQKLHASAKSATTVTEHANVAKQYRAHASSLEARAKAHEEEAERLLEQASKSAMYVKWPALAKGPAERERQQAEKLRKQAGEAIQSAAKHEAEARVLQARQ